ncbi:MAG: hypothetical protein GC129_02030 [Proteobacteria bacterium]|nr:hypothetical protein [Pseudomonadota bacterium]
MLNTQTLGPLTKAKLDFHTTQHPNHKLRRYTRTRIGLAMGYGVYRILPVEDLRNLHKPVRGNPHLRQYDLLPKGVPACDLACINVYLEQVVGMEPCPFGLLVRRGIWHNGQWRELAQKSVLWGHFSHTPFPVSEL